MLRVTLAEPGRFVTEEDAPIPEVGERQALIKVAKVGVCGSDIHTYHGKHPFVSCPIVLGHEFSGTVDRVGGKVKGLYPGERVTAMPQVVCGYCHQCRHGRYNICANLKVLGCHVQGAAADYIAVEADMVVKLPAGLSLELGAAVEPAAVGVRAAKRGEVAGKNVVVYGAGTIGNLTAQAAAALGANVIITDLSQRRLDLALECGIPHATLPDGLDGLVGREFGVDRADVAFECIGAEATIQKAIETARNGSRIIVVGVFARNASVNMGLLQDNELEVIGSLMYDQDDFMDAVRLMAAGTVKVSPLIMRRFNIRQYPEAFKFIKESPDEAVKVMMEP